MLKQNFADNRAIVAWLEYGPMDAADRMKWVRHLRAVAEPVARSASEGAAAGRGSAGAIGSLLEAAVHGTVVDVKPGPRDGPEVRLWAALVDPGIEPGTFGTPFDSGPLFDQGLYKAIEVWTESELCGLHALWNLAQVRGRDDWRRRAASARDWHVANTQPDNATNRPWALHVFLLGGSAECVHYAQTLLHNCMVTNGRPDPLSAWVLLDAVNAIEREGNGATTCSGAKGGAGAR